MSEQHSSGNLYARRAQDASKYSDEENVSALEPHPAIFTIPTHAATHAPSPSDELSEESLLDSLHNVRLEGRPAPTIELVNQREENISFSNGSKATSITKGLRPSSSPSTSSHNTVTAQSQSIAHRTFSFKREQPRMPRSSLRVDETPFPGLVADLTGSPPDYEEQVYSANLYHGSRSNHPPLPIGPGAQGRFPRWRGWLEKRAVERHLERLDTAAVQGEEAVQRKKSWGAGVDDENAVSDGEDQGEVEMPMPQRGVLHLHNLGSRFIPHLPSLPLCSVFLDLPPAPQSSRTGQRLLRRSIPEGIKRKVLLIGTADGLYVAETRRRRKRDGLDGSETLKRRSKAEGKRKEQIEGGWNDDVRCRKVWSGMGIYQMSVLHSKATEAEARTSKYGFSFLASPPQDVSILIALCSTAKDVYKAQTVYTNAQANSSTFNTVGSGGASSLKETGTPFVASSHFGTDNGGGTAKVLPANGTGSVRMWSLEALRRVVANTLDIEEPRVLDLLYSRSKTFNNSDKKGNLKMKIRKAWASLGEPSSERKAKRFSRQSGSFGATTDQDATPRINEFRSKMSAEPEAYSPTTQHRSESRTSTKSNLIDEFGMTGDEEEKNVDDSGYEECLRLAQSSILVKLPGTTSSSSQHVNLGQGGSLTSLKSDESMGAGGTSTSGHGSSINSHSTAGGKGVLFFSVFEANSEVGTAGTWYLSLVTSKSIYLYEAPRPTSPAESRMWVFVKEYYTPQSPKGIAFIFSEASEVDLSRQSSTTPLRKQNSHTTSHNSTLGSPQHQQVKSSRYSSVFRSHADLTLFVSFGKRAVLIRASDASVKEVEWTDSEAHSTASSDLGHGIFHQQSLSNSHKRRSLSADLWGGSDVGHSNQQWIGAEKVTSKVIIRCKHHSPLELGASAQGNNHAAPTSRFDDGDDDDDDFEEEGQPYGLGVTLQDPPASQGHFHSILRRDTILSTPTTVEPAHTLYAKLALLSRGCSTFLFPLPLSWDLQQQRPLGKFTWSDTPTAVMAWSTVVGLERDLSSGPISVSSLRSSRKEEQGDNMVQLHVKVTAVAFLPSRIELKRRRIKIQVKVPFIFNRDSELVLEAIVKGEDQQRDDLADKLLAGDDEESEEVAETTFFNQELEYLCGLLCVTPKGHDVAKPWEAGGEEGAWGFDWRGAKDFRLFYVSARI